MEELRNEPILELTVHDQNYKVMASDVTPETSLVDYLRKKMHLTGTKYMCKEGGCGTCIVNVTMKHPVTRKVETLAVNSCLVSIFQCSNQWKVTTNEGLVTSDGKLNEVQDALMKFNGTQCGFCSSGMVMTMHALKEKGGDVKMKDVEDVLGGNICRCTGYRPILSAFKSLASDATEDFVGKLPDIEDFPACGKKEFCQGKCENDFCKKGKGALYYDLGDNGKWYRVETINEIMGVINRNPNKTYKLVAGNTAKGVYWDLSRAEIYIDIFLVKELKTIEVNTESIVVGGNITLNELIEICNRTSQNDVKNFSYLKKVKEHLELVAHTSVRNIGTIAGNLMIKHGFHEFPSDIFLLLETINATLVIVDPNGDEIHVSPSNFLKRNMNKNIIKQIILPGLDSATYKFESYKIMPRAQNAHAMLNAGFLFKMNQNNVVSANIVYGGINPNFVHAKMAESFVARKNLYDNATLEGLFSALDKELVPDYVLPDPCPDFRKKLAIALAYKFVLSIAPGLDARLTTGGQKLIRDLSKGSQEYDTDQSMYPLSKPISKLEAKAQVSGEAEYVFDKPDRPGQLFGAFVLARAPTGSKVKNVDTSAAQKVEGFVKFYDVKSIKGIRNSFVPTPWEEDPLFVDTTVKYNGQALGLAVATSQNAAESCARAVKVTYEASGKKPLLSTRDVLASGEKERIIHKETIVPKRTGNNVKKEINGKFDIYDQFHFAMETQNCFIVPKENGVYHVYSATQWPDLLQQSCAQILGEDMNKVFVEVRRCGGAYGSKISRANLPACAGIIAAADLKKPIKVWMPLMDNMDAVGFRNPATADYTVKVDEKGVIQSLDLKYYSDVGLTENEAPIAMAIEMFMKCYVSETYSIDISTVKTDLAQRTWTRAPGSTEGHAIMENIMEHIAHEMKLDPVELRMANLDKELNKKLVEFMNEFKVWAEVDKRKADVKTFNEKNRWRKRGFSMLPLSYNLLFENCFTVDVSIFHDGSVSISHGGVEIGQGINTKAAQTVAYKLKIDIDKINVIPANTFSGVNSFVTGGSQTSEAVCVGLVKACNTLNSRIDPVREDMKKSNGKDPSWPDLINECFIRGVNLSSKDTWTKDDAKNYLIYCIAATEVEFDVLTGNHIVTRVDLLEDTGTSMNPYIDIGQVEGAFVMGMGYWTMEESIRDPNGKLMNNRTWNYKVPGAKDIPVDFRVKFPKGNPNPESPFKTKATAEPPLNLAFSVALALKDAINSARLEADKNATNWQNIDGGFTVERNFLNSLHNFKQYTL